MIFLTPYLIQDLHKASGSHKRKLCEDDSSSCHKPREKERGSEHRSSKDRPSEHKSSKDRSSEHRSKEHRSSKDRSSEYRKEKSDKHSSKHHRDRKSSRKPTVASVGVQCEEIVDQIRTVPVIADSEAVEVSIDPPVTNPVPDEDEKPLLTFSSSDTPPRKLCGYSLANPLRSLQGQRGYKWGHLMYLEVYPNGGGKILHSWQEDLDRLSDEENRAFADEFITEAFIEVNDFAVYCCAIVHNAAKGLPDFLEYLGEEHASLPVKHGVIGHPRELETTTMQVGTVRDFKEIF